jgi:hypothetical protein
MPEPFLSREISRELVRVNRRFARASSDVDVFGFDHAARDRPIVGVADLPPTQEQHTASRLFN